ncbi:MAG: HDOD domain protein [Betaproteobacteria bacterium ADurb.Bin341]|nr:MAG: HDOD domain protein [Betaproteobacteria bacterium ADurb.Bin341]
MIELKPQQPDKTGKALAEQRFQMLEDIAKELAGEVVFPVCFDVAMNLRRLLDNPNTPLGKIERAVSADPVISSKLLALANSAAYASSTPVRDIKSAISRLGLRSVRTVSLNIAMRQMLLSAKLASLKEITQQIWDHSLLTASACHVLAQRMTRISPDEAFLAGMVHDIGGFYMLYRAAQYPELLERPESLKYLVVNWHESIGVSVLGALGMPESIVEASRDHDCVRPDPPAVPKTLGDLVYVGNILAGGYYEWLYHGIDEEMLKAYHLGPQYFELEDEIRAFAQETGAIFQ